MAVLGQLVGLSHTPCWRRVKQLKAGGAIRDEIVECFSMSGESDYIFRIIVENIDDMRTFFKEGAFALSWCRFGEFSFRAQMPEADDQTGRKRAKTLAPFQALGAC